MRKNARTDATYTHIHVDKLQPAVEFRHKVDGTIDGNGGNRPTREMDISAYRNESRDSVETYKRP
jgi:hypothetical protein